MSQFFNSVSSGNLPPNIPTTFVTDDGNAIPASNTLNVNGDNGITTKANPTGSDNLVVKFLSGTGSTAGAGTAVILTDTPPDNATTTYQILVAGFDNANDAGVGGQLIATIRKKSGAATIIGTPDDVFNADNLPVIGGLTMNDADFTAIANAGNLEVVVTGVLGFNIAWTAIIAGKT